MLGPGFGHEGRQKIFVCAVKEAKKFCLPEASAGGEFQLTHCAEW